MSTDEQLYHHLMVAYNFLCSLLVYPVEVLELYELFSRKHTEGYGR